VIFFRLCVRAPLTVILSEGVLFVRVIGGEESLEFRV
jgi:hypothetical protein